MTQAAKLKARLLQPKLVIAPGAYDCITARLIQHAGFEAVYMTGGGTSVAHGFPDFGLITMSEMVENAARIANSLDVPLIADADTGYGNELNVFRTVREYENRGVAAIHLEDQEFPKRCGHLDEKRLIDCDEFIARIHAAVAARQASHFLIIARTDSRATLGFKEAIRRVNLALEAGADVAFVEAPQTIEELATIPQSVNGPCLLNVVDNGKTPTVTLDWAEKKGFRIAILPTMLLSKIVETCETALSLLRTTGEPPQSVQNFSPASLFAKFDSEKWEMRRTQFRRPQSE